MRLITKESRDSVRNAIFDRHSADGYTRENYKNLVIFYKENEPGKWYLHIYSGNSTKDMNRYYYRTFERLQETIKQYKDNSDRSEARKLEQATKQKTDAETRAKLAASGQTVQADTKKSTILLKKMIREKYGIECSVRSEFYSMGCSLNISYNLGIDDEELNFIKSALQYGTFDSMTDCSGVREVSGLVVDNFKLETFKHVFVKQEISSEFWEKLCKMHSEKIGYSQAEPIQDNETSFKRFNERVMNAWDWNQLTHQCFKTRNFVTQDESKITLIDCKSVNENGGWDIYFVYEVDGLQYDTRFYAKKGKEPAKETKTAPQFAKIEVEPGTVQVIEYSEKSIAVIGDTKPIKDDLKRLGGSFNFRLTCGAGWIFPKSKLNALQAFLSQPKETTEQAEIIETETPEAATVEEIPTAKVINFVQPSLLQAVKQMVLF